MSDRNRVFAELREAGPVTTPRPGVHLVVGYEAVAEVLRDHDRFSGARPSTLQGLRPPGDLTLQEMDGERHMDMRRIMLTAMPRNLVDRFEPSLAAHCHRLAAALVPRGRAELMAELVEPSAKEVVGELIGVPEADRERVNRWAAGLKEHDATAPPTRGDKAPRPPAARKAFVRWIREQAERRRREARPPDDVFTRLLTSRTARGEPLQEDELATQILFLSRAGIGSMVRLTGNLLYELIRVPERYDCVRLHRDLLPAAIDESLRHDPPGDFVARTCVHGTTLAETCVRPGDQVILSLTSAHRDETRFPKAEEYDLDRGRVPDHLAFGRGRHRCPGAALARMFAAQAVNALMDTVETIRLAPGFVFENISFAARGPRRLDVEFAPQAGPTRLS
jgi:cytochrome P450